MSPLYIFLTFIALKIQNNAQNTTMNATLPCDGCTSGTIEGGVDCYNLVTGNVYACRGTFSGGVANGASICAEGYEICPSAARAGALGLTDTICGNISNNNEFYTSLQSGAKAGQCSDSGTNDIYGCARLDPSNEDKLNLVTEYSGFGCDDTFVAMLYNHAEVPANNLQGWSFGSNTDDELTTASLARSTNGGVLCCTLPPTQEPTANPTTSEPTTFHPATAAPSTMEPTNAPSMNPTTSYPSLQPTGFPTTYSPLSEVSVPPNQPEEQEEVQNTDNNEEQVTFIVNIYLVIAVSSAICCLIICCIGFILYTKHRRNKQRAKEKRSSKLRVHSVSPVLGSKSPTVNSAVIPSIDIDIAVNQFTMDSEGNVPDSNVGASFGRNLTDLSAANDILMNDVMHDMDVRDEDDEKANIAGHVTKGGPESPYSEDDDIYDEPGPGEGFETTGQ